MGFKKLDLAAGLLSGLLLSSTSASAVNVPVPADGATLNLNVQLQPWIRVAEDATTQGNVGEDVYLRRVRLLAQGNFNKEFLYLIQLDTPNFGKGGDFTTRELIQDAWIAWNPIEGLYLDAGMLLLPVSRHTLQSTTDYTNFDFHVNSLHSPNTNGLRDNGLSLRGWLFDKKVGYRFGAYEGVRSTTPPGNARLNPHGTPRLAGFVNFNIVGSEEGAWLYHGLYFDKAVVSLGLGGEYQSGALLNAAANVTDHSYYSADLFVDLPFAGNTREFIFSAVVARNNAGTNAADTGSSGFVDVGYRIGVVQPYVSTEFFAGDSCSLTPGVCKANTDDLRIGSAGVNFWIKRNQMHISTEYAYTRSGVLGTRHQQTFTTEWSMFF